MNERLAIAHVIEELSTELSASLHYHSLEHTKEVMRSAEEIGLSEHIDEREMNLLLTAAAYHDSGFMFTYSEHEERGCQYAREILPDFNYTNEDIDIICELIMCTKVPQRAETLLGQILCDADLDYLGEDDYETISNSLRKEMWENGIALDDHRWLDVQIDFLKAHNYFTEFSLTKRKAGKDKVLQQLIDERMERFGV